MDNRLTAQQWTSCDGEALDRGRPSRLAEEAVLPLISGKWWMIPAGGPPRHA